MSTENPLDFHEKKFLSHLLQKVCFFCKITAKLIDNLTDLMENLIKYII